MTELDPNFYQNLPHIDVKKNELEFNGSIEITFTVNDTLEFMDQHERFWKLSPKQLSLLLVGKFKNVIDYNTKLFGENDRFTEDIFEQFDEDWFKDWLEEHLDVRIHVGNRVELFERNTKQFTSEIIISINVDAPVDLWVIDEDTNQEDLKTYSPAEIGELIKNAMEFELEQELIDGNNYFWSYIDDELQIRSEDHEMINMWFNKNVMVLFNKQVIKPLSENI